MPSVLKGPPEQASGETGWKPDNQHHGSQEHDDCSRGAWMVALGNWEEHRDASCGECSRTDGAARERWG